MTNFTIAIDKSNVINKLAFLKRALVKSTRQITLFASLCASPPWMTREKCVENSHIIGESGEPYWQALALYYSRFLDEYKKEGIEFWAMITQNEEPSAQRLLLAWQQLRFNATQERDFLNRDFGLLLQKIIHHSRSLIWTTGKTICPMATQRWWSRGANLAKFHATYPDIFICNRSMCGSMPDGIGTGRDTKLQDLAVVWKRGEIYARAIINDLANFAVGWTDWNLMLDTHGDPNWATNFVDAPTIVDEKHGAEFYKQPMNYVMGHLSKLFLTREFDPCLPRRRIRGGELDGNWANSPIELIVRDAQGKRDVQGTLPANAVQTILFGIGWPTDNTTSSPSAPGKASEVSALASASASVVRLFVASLVAVATLHQ